MSNLASKIKHLILFNTKPSKTNCPVKYIHRRVGRGRGGGGGGGKWLDLYLFYKQYLNLNLEDLKQSKSGEKYIQLFFPLPVLYVFLFVFNFIFFNYFNFILQTWFLFCCLDFFLNA